MSTYEKIAIVLLNWNSTERTLHTLERLKSWEKIKFTVFLIDNNSSSDISSRISELYINVQLLRNDKNIGFSGGCNVGFREIFIQIEQECCLGLRTFRYILLLNTDAWIEEEGVQQLVTTMTEQPAIGVIGPVIVDRKDRNAVISAGGLDPATHVYTYCTGPDAKKNIEMQKPFLVDYVSGTVALIRINILEETGLFDERYFFSCEMADLCERMLRKGYKCVIDPNSIAWHDMEESRDHRNTLYLYYQLRNRFLFIWKFRRIYVPILFPCWLLFGGTLLLKSLVVGNKDTAKAVYYGLRDGITGNYGNRNYLFSRRLGDE